MASLVGFGGGWWGSGAYKMQSTYSNGYPYLSGRCRFSLWLDRSIRLHSILSTKIQNKSQNPIFWPKMATKLLSTVKRSNAV
ncbi:hypothetical protein YC2023_102097 [Brassica napus]